MLRGLRWCLGLGLCACGVADGHDEAGLDAEGSVTADGTTGGLTGSGGSATAPESDTGGVDSGTGTTTATTTATEAGPDGSGDSGPPPPMALPPVNAGLDYQLGGAYPPPAGVEIVSRDRNDAPAAGLYNIC